VPADYEHAGCLRLGSDLVDQPRLSKARFTGDERNTSATSDGAAHCVAQQRPFLRSSDIRRAARTGSHPSSNAFGGHRLGLGAPGHLPQAPPLGETFQLDALMILEREILGGAENGFQNI
jgi:hypothetical protein